MIINMRFPKVCVNVLFSCMLVFTYETQGKEPDKREIQHPKNVVLFLARDLTIEAVNATRIELANIMRNETLPDTNYLLPFENLPQFGLLTTDGATGTKQILNGTQDWNTQACKNTTTTFYSNIVSLANNAGKSTGIVCLSREDAVSVSMCEGYNMNMCQNTSKCSNVINQIFNSEIGNNRDAIFDEAYKNIDNNTDKGIEGSLLITQGKLPMKLKNETQNRVLLNSVNDLNNMTINKGEQVIGLFPKVSFGDLKIMTSQTLDILKMNEEGYFLIVIIKDGNAVKTVKRVSKLIPLYLKKTNPKETLFVFTSDHVDFMMGCGMQCQSNEYVKNTSENITNKQDVLKSVTNTTPFSIEMKTTNNSLETFKRFYEQNITTLNNSVEDKTNLNKSGVILVDQSTGVLGVKENRSEKSAVLLGQSNSKPLREINSSEPIFNKKISVFPKKGQNDATEKPLNTNFTAIKTNTEYTEKRPITLPLKPSNVLNNPSILKSENETILPIDNENILVHFEKNRTVQEENSLNNIENKGLKLTENNQIINKSVDFSKYHSNLSEILTTKSSINQEVTTVFIDQTNPPTTIESAENVSEESFSTFSSFAEANNNSMENEEFFTTDNPSHERRKREAEFESACSDIPIYASGPMSMLFRGVHKKDLFWKVIKKSMCFNILTTNVTGCELDLIELRDITEIKLKTQSGENTTAAAMTKFKISLSQFLIIIISILVDVHMWICGITFCNQVIENNF